MAGSDGLFGRFRRPRQVYLGGAEPEPSGGMARHLRLPLWLLTAWTAVAGLCLLLLHDDLSRIFAAGLADAPGQRLLGVAMLLLALVFGSLAAGPRVNAPLRWLPLISQVAIAMVIGFEVLAGNRGFGWSVVDLMASLIFAVLIVAHRLVGEPIVPRENRRAVPEPDEQRLPAQAEEMPTEQLAPRRTASFEAPPKPEQEPPPDESVLGI